MKITNIQILNEYEWGTHYFLTFDNDCNRHIDGEENLLNEFKDELEEYSPKFLDLLLTNKKINDIIKA